MIIACDNSVAQTILNHFVAVQVMGCDEKKMIDWLHDVCELREQEAKKITEGLAEKANKMLAV